MGVAQLPTVWEPTGGIGCWSGMLSSLYIGFYSIPIFRSQPCASIQKANSFSWKSGIWGLCVLTVQKTHTLTFQVAVAFQPESLCPLYREWGFSRERRIKIRSIDQRKPLTEQGSLYGGKGSSQGYESHSVWLSICPKSSWSQEVICPRLLPAPFCCLGLDAAFVL